MGLTGDERLVRERLEAWELRIQRILAVYTRDGLLPADQQAVVRSSYAGLKVSMRAAVKIGESEQGRARMSEAEKRFYYPAMRAAVAHVGSRAEPRPEAWFRSLCNALAEISAAVIRLSEEPRDMST